MTEFIDMHAQKVDDLVIVLHVVQPLLEPIRWKVSDWNLLYNIVQ
jgi:hypothetical protein